MKRTTETVLRDEIDRAEKALARAVDRHTSASLATTEAHAAHLRALDAMNSRAAECRDRTADLERARATLATFLGQPTLDLEVAVSVEGETPTPVVSVDGKRVRGGTVRPGEVFEVGPDEPVKPVSPKRRGHQVVTS